MCRIRGVCSWMDCLRPQQLSKTLVVALQINDIEYMNGFLEIREN